MASSSGISACCPPTNQRIMSDIAPGLALLVEDRLATPVLEREMQMAGLARIGVRPFGHEGGHLALPLGQHLREGLEQDGAVRREQSVGIFDRGFEHARTRLGVQAFERHVHGERRAS